MEKIRGIGKVKQRELEKRGIKTKADLEKIIDELPVAAQIDLKYKVETSIPHEMMKKIVLVLKKIIKVKHIVAGSYRRKTPFSKDIDMLIVAEPLGTDPLNVIINMFSRSRVRVPFKISPQEIYMAGSDRIAVLIRAQDKFYNLDIFIVPIREWIPALTYATGSRDFNIRMRANAKRKGMKLNQRGLYRLSTGKKIPISSEKDLFKKLNMTWKSPQSRSV